MESQSYTLLIYQMPSNPSSARVSIWRELKRLGVLYVQQSACVLPQREPFLTTLQLTIKRIKELGGSYHLFPLTHLPPEEEEKLIDGFIAQSNLQYDEIIENGEVDFAKEIEFESFRQNFTYAEAEEIRHDLEKLRRWYDRVVERDWFGAARRKDALQCIHHCEALLEKFEEQVFLKQAADETVQLPEHLLHPRRIDREEEDVSQLDD